MPRPSRRPGPGGSARRGVGKRSRPTPKNRIPKSPIPKRLRRAVRPAAAAVRRWGPRLRRRFRRRAPHLRLGARGERIAARALRRAGYRVVARNYRPGGPSAPELDLVAWEGRTLAVVEVKTRRGGLGRPLERVDEEKRRRLRRAAARMWTVESRRRRIPPGSNLRLDVVEVWFPAPLSRPAPDRLPDRPTGARRPAPPEGAGGRRFGRVVGPAARRWGRRIRTAVERPVVRIRRGVV